MSISTSAEPVKSEDKFSNGMRCFSKTTQSASDQNIKRRLCVPSYSLMILSSLTLDCWADHFCSLGQSQSDSNDNLKLSKQNIDSILTTSFSEYDDILDTDIEGEEVEVAIRHLKRNHAGGPDALSPEHLKYSGPIFRHWLCQIYNHICHLERIPQCFKHGIVIPSYKGKGRDPLLKKSYGGITLSSVLAKVLEVVLMERISPLL